MANFWYLLLELKLPVHAKPEQVFRPIEVLHGSHVAWEEQKIPFPMGKEVLSYAKYFHCSCHATWLPCKTSIGVLTGRFKELRHSKVTHKFVFFYNVTSPPSPQLQCHVAKNTSFPVPGENSRPSFFVLVARLARQFRMSKTSHIEFTALSYLLYYCCALSMHVTLPSFFS